MVGAEKLGTGGLVLDYAEYLESLAARSGGLEVIQNDRKNRDSFYYNKQVGAVPCTARSTRICSRSIISRSIRCISSALSPFEALQPPAASHARLDLTGYFYPPVEKNRLISQITELQLRRVCRFCAKTRRSRASIANVKINLSPLDLIHSDGGSHLIRILDEYGLPYSLLPV